MQKFKLWCGLLLYVIKGSQLINCYFICNIQQLYFSRKKNLSKKNAGCLPYNYPTHLSINVDDKTNKKRSITTAGKKNGFPHTTEMSYYHVSILKIETKNRHSLHNPPLRKKTRLALKTNFVLFLEELKKLEPARI